MTASSRFTRRQFLLTVGAAGTVLAAGGVLQACSGSGAAPASAGASNPAAAASSGGASQSPGSQAGSGKPAASASASSVAAPADWQAQWDRTMAAGKQEGRVTLIVPPGDAYRPVFDEFQKKYGVAIETLAGNGQADLVPRLSTERKASQFLWDLAVHSPAALFAGFKPLGALAPLRPALLLPEILDDAKWLGGFNAGWNDIEKAYGYTFIGEVIAAVHVNRDIVPETQLSKLDQLWEPQWKGKIAMQDPRVPSSGTQKLSAFLRLKGEEKLRAFLQQQPVLTQDRRQLGEWVVRGQYPIGLGVVPSVLSDFAKQGLSIKNIKPLDYPDPAAKALSGGAGALGLLTNGPHPNAAKLFANWLLGADGQKILAQSAGYNSRRLDVYIVDPDGAVDPKEYGTINRADADLEEAYPNYLKTLEISKEVLK